MEEAKTQLTVTPRLYGLFVSYYADHFSRAWESFCAFADTLGFDYTLTIVNNNPANRIPGAIRGDNKNTEFTGWDAGLATLGEIRPNDMVIFCNDTFSNHRGWSGGDRRRFSAAMRLLAASGGQGICGEVHSYGEPFEILGLSADRWVSTYLFALTGSLVNRLGRRLSIREELLHRIAPGIGEAGVKWGEGITDGLKRHLDEWVFPHKAGTGWYRAATAPSDVKLRKVKAILNEKYLTAWCAANEGAIVDAGPGYVLRKAREIKGRYINRLLLGR